MRSKRYLIICLFIFIAFFGCNTKTGVNNALMVQADQKYAEKYTHAAQMTQNWVEAVQEDGFSIEPWVFVDKPLSDANINAHNIIIRYPQIQFTDDTMYTYENENWINETLFEHLVSLQRAKDRRENYIFYSFYDITYASDRYISLRFWSCHDGLPRILDNLYGLTIDIQNQQIVSLSNLYNDRLMLKDQFENGYFVPVEHFTGEYDIITCESIIDDSFFNGEYNFFIETPLSEHISDFYITQDKLNIIINVPTVKGEYAVFSTDFYLN